MKCRVVAECPEGVGREELGSPAMVAGHVAANPDFDRRGPIALLAEAGKEAGDFLDPRRRNARFLRRAEKFCVGQEPEPILDRAQVLNDHVTSSP